MKCMGDFGELSPESRMRISNREPGMIKPTEDNKEESFYYYSEEIPGQTSTSVSQDMVPSIYNVIPGAKYKSNEIQALAPIKTGREVKIVSPVRTELKRPVQEVTRVKASASKPKMKKPKVKNTKNYKASKLDGMQGNYSMGDFGASNISSSTTRRNVSSARSAIKKTVKTPVRKHLKPTIRPSVKPSVRPSVKPAIRASVKPVTKRPVKAGVKPTIKAPVKRTAKYDARQIPKKVMKQAPNIAIKPNINMAINPTVNPVIKQSVSSEPQIVASNGSLPVKTSSSMGAVGMAGVAAAVLGAGYFFFKD